MHSVHFHNLGVNPGHDIEQDNPQSHSSDQTAYLQPSTSEVTDLPIQDPSWQHGSRFTNIQPGVSDDTLGPLLSPGRTTFPASEFQTVQSSTSSNPSWTPNTILPFSPQHILDLTPVRSIPATPHLYEASSSTSALPADLRPPIERPICPRPLGVEGALPFGLLGTSSATHVDPVNFIAVRVNTEPEFRDDQTDPTLHFKQMPYAAPKPVMIQVQNTSSAEASSQREQRVQEKKYRDKERKRGERFDQSMDHARICELLGISLTPTKTLPKRILDAVEKLVEMRDRFDDLQHQLKALETEGALLKQKLAQHPT